MTRIRTSKTAIAMATIAPVLRPTVVWLEPGRVVELVVVVVEFVPGSTVVEFVPGSTAGRCWSPGEIRGGVRGWRVLRGGRGWNGRRALAECGLAGDGEN